ncbi:MULTISPECIES: Bug family tripartite tricarboxylate transporter substrate binding protein [Delftia]|uniref:Tripartite-type tricarboxylate transporter, receptor component TctC n=1 Tax=Delftia lacustris TaxID=558537 RepID=A0A1H3GEW3_9BURK|nr:MULTISPECIES: tripartite tricarboxylate transporter substrate binding protein [Delftia]MDH0776244.1 tripartite tricarboxylate transporter substrate binding protein [Delftia tsuruhatensis]MDH1459836.1 tripartite tricarboxylate transporter substrate binding protein [Delftia tsuruhatensis]MDH1823164.1 tripartite tricarboxylate transporter substrate binding protein [Delftia tsuruhatensis]WGG12586.1 tripartite tricarboxylate transporter substrate binding protein [Delftia tsuruhatensis]SDY01610.1
MRTAFPLFSEARQVLSRRSLLGAAALGLVLPAAAQGSFPAKPLKLVVGYPAGGSVDLAARVVGDGLAARLRGTVVVDNVGGAAGAIAAQRVASAPADGYTLLVGASNELVATRIVNPAQRYDGRRDFTPLGLVATSPLILAARPGLGVKTLAELLELAKRQPGKLSYGSSGVGSTLHFAGELLNQRAGISIAHVPYRGVAPLTSDLAGGSLDLAVLSPTAAQPFLQSGRIVPLAVTSAQRLSALPQVPAMAELAPLRGYELVGWFALMAPRALPADTAQRITAALQEALAEPAVRKRLEDAGMVPATGREDLARLIAEEDRKYEQLAAFAKMRD